MGKKFNEMIYGLLILVGIIGIVMCFHFGTTQLIKGGTIIDKFYQTDKDGKDSYNTHPVFVINFGDFGIITINPTTEAYYTHIIGSRIYYDIYEYTARGEKMNTILTIVAAISVCLIIVSFIALIYSLTQ
jgi:hypothetical protein